MQVAFVHPTAPFREGTGASHSATEIATGLVDRGHDVTVYCQNERPGDNWGGQYDVLSYPERFPHEGNEQLNKALRERRCDLESFDLVHSYLMSAIPSLTTLDGQTATVVTLNAYGGVCPKNDLQYKGNTDCDRNGPLRCAGCTLYEGATAGTFEGRALPSRIARIGYQPLKALRRLRLIERGRGRIDRIDGFQALSGHIKETYSDFGFPASAIDVVPNILDEQFCVEHESNFEPPYRLLYVGYLKHHKGVDRLVPILSQLRSTLNIPVTLTVVGDGDSRETMERQVRDQGLEEAVEFRGHVPYESLPSIYAAHDCFVYPGRWHEPFGRVFIEALSAGTPVVATDVGAIEEILDGAGTTAPNDTDALASTLAETLLSKKLETYAARTEGAIGRYRKERVMDQIEALYQRALESAQGSNTDR